MFFISLQTRSTIGLKALKDQSVFSFQSLSCEKRRVSTFKEMTPVYGGGCCTGISRKNSFNKICAKV